MTERLKAAAERIAAKEPSLQDIEEAKKCLWVEQQLIRIRQHLVKHNADDEMLNAVDFCLEDNNEWLDPKIADDLRAGKFPEGEG
jgi:hypothetical protein